MNRATYALLTAGLLAVVGIAVTVGLLTGAETGSMADWVAAVATVAAFGAATLAARFAASAFALESDRDSQSLLSNGGARPL
jgi:hypothetical protein